MEQFLAIKELQRRYPDHVALVYRHFTAYDGPSYELALASECVDEQGAFPNFYDSVFAKDWRVVNRDELARFAVSIGVKDSASFEACMEDRLFEETVVRDIRAAKDLRFDGTPALMINGVRLAAGAVSLSVLERIVVRTLRQ